MLIPKNFKNDTRELICASLAKSTWEKNASALNCLKSFELESKITASWPLDKTVLRNFTTWALMQRKLKPLTVQSYLSSLASIHKLRDLDFSVFDDYIVKRALRGAENLNFYSSMIGGARKVMTLPLLKYWVTGFQSQIGMTGINRCFGQRQQLHFLALSDLAKFWLSLRVLFTKLRHFYGKIFL
jgi:hypothetical protein